MISSNTTGIVQTGQDERRCRLPLCSCLTWKHISLFRPSYVGRQSGEFVSFSDVPEYKVHGLLFLHILARLANDDRLSEERLGYHQGQEGKKRLSMRFLNDL